MKTYIMCRVMPGFSYAPIDRSFIFAYIISASYYDGALGAPVPVEKAFACGCDRVVVLLTKPENVIRTSAQDEKLANRIRKKYPHAAEKLRQRANRYNEGVALAQEYARQGKALIIAPDDTCGVSTLSRDPANMKRLYKKGYDDGEKIKSFMGFVK